ncbi:MAG: HD domain-containing protein [Myxococcales bacterium]|nr:MAG: HD domain-containing protein [Myxococcales bacterium]
MEEWMSQQAERKSTAALVAVVDDDPLVRQLFVQALLRKGHLTEGFASASQALQAVASGGHRLVITDIDMPGQSGVWLLAQLQSLPKPPLTIMVTGQDDTRQAIHCLTNGAYDFLLKPVDLVHFVQKVSSALDFIRLAEERRRHQELVEDVAISERWRARQLFLSGIDALIRALEAKDDYTEGHSTRVAVIAEAMAARAKLRPGEVNELITAARCHDIGKIGIPDAVLLKGGRLTTGEYARIKDHPQHGARILEPIFRDMPAVVAAVRHHHERYDGAGYPDGLKGEAVPLYARIISVADAFDAMTSNRIYRRALSGREAVEELQRGAGRQFCPRAVTWFLDVYDEIADVAGGEPWLNMRCERRLEHDIELVLETSEARLPGRLLNLSACGLRVQTALCVAVGQEVRLEMIGLTPIRTLVTWSNPIGPEEATLHQLGLKTIEPSEDYLAYVRSLARPKTERRGRARINYVLPVSLSTAEGVSEQNAVNVSIGGLFLHTRAPLPVGAEIGLRFALPDAGTAPIEAQATVTHRLTVAEALRAEGAIPGMGMAFSALSPADAERLTAFVESRMAETRLRSLLGAAQSRAAAPAADMAAAHRPWRLPAITN